MKTIVEIEWDSPDSRHNQQSSQPKYVLHLRKKHASRYSVFDDKLGKRNDYEEIPAEELSPCSICKVEKENNRLQKESEESWDIKMREYHKKLTAQIAENDKLREENEKLILANKS